MSDISIKWAKADGLLSDLDKSQSQIFSAADRLKSECNMNCLRSWRGNQIGNRVRQIARDLDNERQNLRHLESGLRTILRLYGNCENNLLDSGLGSMFSEMIGEAGSIGTIEKIFQSLLDGNVLEVVQNLLGLGENVEMWPSDGKPINAEWFKEVAGLSTAESEELLNNALGLPNGLTQASDIKSFLTTHPVQSVKNLFSEAMKGEVNDWKLPQGGGSKAEWAKSVCKWAGAAISTITSGIENYKEFDGFSGRMLGETVVETATDIGVGMVVNGAVSAGAAAIAVAVGAAGAPAVVVGAATVAVTWALNWGCSKLTGGKDIGEVVGDFVCDTAEKIGDGAKRLWERITELSNHSVSPSGAAIPV